MGHFLNMVLKDIFVKIALLDRQVREVRSGLGHARAADRVRDAQAFGHHATSTRSIPLELRARCRERALFWLDRQRETARAHGQFRLFDRPYRTIDPSFEATIVDALADLAERQQIYKGLRSTLWCIHDETALAEAEIEYETARLALDLRALHRPIATNSAKSRIDSSAMSASRFDGESRSRS